MTGAAWLQLLALVACIGVGHPHPRSVPRRRVRRRGAGLRRPGVLGDRATRSTGCAGSNPEREQRWTTYAYSLLAFSGVSVLVLYALQRFQGSLPFNPTDVGAVPEALSFNTAVSFVTNTNWQNYAGENTMSYLTQMAGLAVQNFVSAAVGLCVAVALIRGLARRRSATIGNFWVDLVRGTVRILLPLCVVIGDRPGEPGRHPDAPRARGGHHPRAGHPVHPRRSLRQPGGHQGARHQRRRHRSTPTPPTRSRTPTASPTSCRWPRSCSSRSPSPTPTGAWSRTRSRAGSCSAPCSCCGPARWPWPPGFEVGGNQSVDHLGVNVTQEVDRPAGGRQHGGQGGPLRPGRLRAVRRHHHRHVDRRGHRRPRQLHPAGRGRAARAT